MYEALLGVLMVLAIIWLAISIANALPKGPLYTPVLVVLAIVVVVVGIYFARGRIDILHA